MWVTLLLRLSVWCACFGKNLTWINWPLSWHIPRRDCRRRHWKLFVPPRACIPPQIIQPRYIYASTMVNDARNVGAHRTLIVVSKRTVGSPWSSLCFQTLCSPPTLGGNFMTHAERMKSVLDFWRVQACRNHKIFMTARNSFIVWIFRILAVFASKFEAWWRMILEYSQQIHTCTVTGPWSSLSMHPVEHILYFSLTFLPLFLPLHPLHLLLIKFHADISGVFFTPILIW